MSDNKKDIDLSVDESHEVPQSARNEPAIGWREEGDPPRTDSKMMNADAVHLEEVKLEENDVGD